MDVIHPPEAATHRHSLVRTRTTARNDHSSEGVIVRHISGRAVFVVWPGHSDIPILTRRRRVWRASPTRLPDSVRCHLPVAYGVFPAASTNTTNGEGSTARALEARPKRISRSVKNRARRMRRAGFATDRQTTGFLRAAGLRKRRKFFPQAPGMGLRRFEKSALVEH
jgi:hypothetical protein